MRYLMLIWAEADAASGDESDLQALGRFRRAGEGQRRVRTQRCTRSRLDRRSSRSDRIAGHALDRAVERRPFADGDRQIEAFYIMDLPTMEAALKWANKLPTYGHVEVRELLQF